MINDALGNPKLRLCLQLQFTKTPIREVAFKYLLIYLNMLFHLLTIFVISVKQ